MIPEPAPAPSPPVAEIVVSRADGSELIATTDTPMTLVKGARREAALVRRAVFITTSLTVVRPAEGDSDGGVRYRWSYEGFVQRQMCFTSMTGLFSCTLAEVERTPDAERGEAPLLGAGSLKARATALFAADRRANLDPMLRAGGVAVASPSAPGKP